MPITDAEIVAKIQGELDKKRVWFGMKVRHVKTGGDYKVICVAKVEATLENVVVYMADHTGGQHWTRPIDEFCDGRFVAR